MKEMFEYVLSDLPGLDCVLLYPPQTLLWPLLLPLLFVSCIVGNCCSVLQTQIINWGRERMEGRRHANK